MEYLSGAVFDPYLEQFADVIEESETLTKSKGGLTHQAAHASAGTVIGGILGGPFGAMIGGIAGAMIGFINVHSYSNIFFIFNRMAADERQEFFQKFRRIISVNVKVTLAKSATSVKDSVTTYVTETSHAVTETVTGSVASVTGSVVSVTGSVIAAPGHVASYVTKTTWNATCATTNVMTGMVTQNFMARYIRKVASSTVQSVTGNGKDTGREM